MTSPTKYRPMTPEQFIGDAANYARIIQNNVRQSRANDFESMKYLFNGPPGLGKTALVHFLQGELGCDDFSTLKYNGTEVKLETVNDLSNKMHYAAISGDYTLFWIDEADKINPIAQVRFLTMLDDLPDGVVIACTSNCKLSEFEGRFQSRFQTYELNPPTKAEIAALLKQWPISADEIAEIAELARGNVRQALLDTRTALNAVA